ncbi:MAG: PLP-dependent transferase [Clostridia bacterium]|nr:PLP-dependent transferase [Clostridia bacterium]
MNTPIADFLNNYAASGAARLHMPGHKGKEAGLGGAETFDITEIPGADSLYEAGGIIDQSEKNAASLFGTHATFYSTEGSSHCIRAMVYLAVLRARQRGETPRILAVRNAHKTYVTAAALPGVQTEWLYPRQGLLSGAAGAEEIKKALEKERFTAVYITSPDYTGGLCDIAAISAVCREHGVLLLCDNAHGAYLKFLPEDLHPITLGADICCDSAHKTLPVLTGGAYLHFAESASGLAANAKNALSLFGSTSPSYLILRSLDLANAYIAGDYKKRLADCVLLVDQAKKRLETAGYSLAGEEPLKITVAPKTRGYTGRELALECESRGIFCDYSDPDCAVFMLTPENGAEDPEKLCSALISLPCRAEIKELPPAVTPKKQVMSAREALLSPCETVAAKDSVGRVCAIPTVGCPPAVPPVCCGEFVDENAVEVMRYYGIESCCVVKQRAFSLRENE